MNLPGRSPRVKRLCLSALAALGVLAFIVVVLPRASAYVLEGPSWASGTVVTFQSTLGNAGRTLTDGNTSWDTAAAPAAADWNVNMGRIVCSYVPNPSTTISRSDGINSISWGNSFFGNGFGSNTLAITGWSSSGGRIIEADIVFNNKITWDSYRGAVRYGSGGAAVGEIRRVLIHEMGHAIGLDHPDTHGQHVTAIMNSIMSSVELPTADDIAGVQAMYGAPTGTPTPTPTATPTASPTATPTPTPTPSATPPQTTVTLSDSSSTVRTGGSVQFTAQLSAPNPSSSTTVNMSMSGNAREGAQYSLSSHQFVIPANSTSASLTLNVLKGPKKAKTATMVLSAGSGFRLANPVSASVRISK